MKMKMSRYVADRIGRSKDDFTVQVFSAGGKGGQNQNRVYSGVRIIDKATGLRAECREHRDQPQNKQAAFEKLVVRLMAFYKAEELRLQGKLPKVTAQVRTYDEPDNMVVDHRTGEHYDYKRVLDGKDLSKVIRDCQEVEAGWRASAC
jgi:peptide chain release factor 2